MGVRHCLVAAALAFAALASLGPDQGSASSAAVDSAVVDVVLAIDGTASMRSSIAQAQKDGQRLIAGLREVTAELRVGVAVFRDYRNPGGEYELLQPLTGDLAAVQSALQKVRAVTNPDPNNRSAESYSLMFRKSHSDPAVGWRRSARKILIVIGDAEPYGAGRGDLNGCQSKTPDPHGLRAEEELARMRAEGIVLFMVRQVSSETRATLTCYEALAERAATGSAARDGGPGGALVEPIVSLMKQSFAPLALHLRDVRLAPGSRARYTLALTNKSVVPMMVKWLRVRLPRELEYVQSSTTRPPSRRRTSNFTFVVWHVSRSLPPGQAVTIRFLARPLKEGRYRAIANGSTRLNSGLVVAPSTRARELLARRPR